jgi:hypothetical protein
MKPIYGRPILHEQYVGVHRCYTVVIFTPQMRTVINLGQELNRTRYITNYFNRQIRRYELMHNLIEHGIFIC